jgi:hypothetical protein
MSENLSASTPQAGKPQPVEMLVFVVLMVLVFGMSVRTPLDSDLWWHLRGGQVTLSQGEPLLIDIFSYTRFGAPWVNHSWLSEVIFSWLFERSGFLSISCLIATVVSLSMALVYSCSEGPALLRAFVIILASVASAPVWSPRPQIFSQLCLAGVMFCLQQVSKSRKWLWVLPGIFTIWSNLHGGYALGLIYLGLWIIGQMIEFVCLKLNLKSLVRNILPLVLVAIVCAFSVLINPNGLDVWRVPFQTIGVSALQQYIPEWASPDFHELSQQPFLLYLLLMIIVLGMVPRRKNIADILIAACFTAMALFARRNFAPMVIVTAPLLCKYGWEIIQEYLPRKKFSKLPNVTVSTKNNLLKKSINLSLVALLWAIVLVKAYVVNYPAYVDSQIKKMYPEGAVNWLLTHQISGNLFNEYNWGGYLIWTSPTIPVFVDGRTDLFGDQILREWITAVQGGEGWQNILDQRGIRTVLLLPDRPLVDKLKKQHWRILFQDSQSIILSQ